MKSFAPKFMIFSTLSLIIGLTTPAFAQQNELPLDGQEVVKPITPPENPDAVIQTQETMDRLFSVLKKETKEASASATARQIWREWSYSGNRSIDLLMGWAMTAMRQQEFSKAQDLLDQVTVLAPEYAEGWNRRATLYYSMEDFSRSISDIETTLKLEPRHFGALSGLAAIMQRLDRDEDALRAWYKVLEIYPANKQAQTSVINLEEKLAGSRT